MVRSRSPAVPRRAPALAVVPPFTDTRVTRSRPISSGCARPRSRRLCRRRFCPDDLVTRDQMASFLVRAFDLPASATNAFTDDEDSTHEAAINGLAASGITGGCAAARFCPAAGRHPRPDGELPARARSLPGATRDYFSDDDRSAHQTDINRLAESGIAGGCGMAASAPMPASRAARWRPSCIGRRPRPAPPAACTLSRRPTSGTVRIDDASGRLELGDDGLGDRRRPRPAPRLRRVPGLRDPVQRRQRRHAGVPVTFDYDDESDDGPYPIPPTPKIEGGSDAPHPHGRQGPAAGSTSSSPRTRSAATGAPAPARSGTCARTRCAPPAGPAPTPPGCRSCPDSSATTRSRRRDRATPCASPPRDAAGLHLPGPPRRQRRPSRRPAADGPAGAPQGHLRHQRLLAAGAGDRCRAPALRDDPRRQRLPWFISGTAESAGTTMSSTS